MISSRALVNPLFSRLAHTRTRMRAGQGPGLTPVTSFRIPRPYGGGQKFNFVYKKPTIKQNKKPHLKRRKQVASTILIALTEQWMDRPSDEQRGQLIDAWKTSQSHLVMTEN